MESDIHRYIETREPSKTESTRLKASPLARRLAKEFGLDLTTIAGSGPDGRIVRDDVMQSVDEIPPQVFQTEPTASEVIELSGIRKIIAERMTMSLQTNASVTLHTEVDADNTCRNTESIQRRITENREKHHIYRPTREDSCHCPA